MFQGTYFYRMDEKGRLKTPAELAHGLGAAFTLTRGMHHCVWAFPETSWKTVAERLRAETLVDPGKLALQRFFIGSAVTLSPDNQGRFIIPAALREYAGIDHEIVLVGLDDRVELWSRERWNAYESRISDEAVEEWARQAGL